MSTTFVTIQLDPGHRVYEPGETLAGRFRWDVFHPDKVQSVELSVLWYTEGKGDEDFGVHYFEEHPVHAGRGWSPSSSSSSSSSQEPARATATRVSESSTRTPAQGSPRDRPPVDQIGDRAGWRPFATRLPHSPLSYDGPLVKIRWCVRVRVFLESGKDVVGEKIFRLGRVQSVIPNAARDQAKRASSATPAALTDSRMEATDW